MNHAREIRPFHQFPDPDYHDNLQRLERDITELAAHINAANYQLLELVGLYDEQQGWVQHGLASCAHWLVGAASAAIWEPFSRLKSVLHRSAP